MMIRSCKIALMAATALFFTLVAYGNLTDYRSNWQFVQHVFSMDTTFLDSMLHYRAITNPVLQTAGYWLIIGTQIVVAMLLWCNCGQLLAARNGPGFGRAKALGCAGLTLGLLLYMTGFVTVGGEWFAMWQSNVWNGQQKAFEFISMIGLVLVVLLMPEPEE